MIKLISSRITWWYFNLALVTVIFLIYSTVNLIEYYHLQNAAIPIELQGQATAKAIESMRLVERYQFASNFIITFDKFLWPLSILAFCLIPRAWYIFDAAVPRMAPSLGKHPNLKVVIFDGLFNLALTISSYLLISILTLSVQPFAILATAFLLLVNSGITLLFLKLHGRMRKLFFPAVLILVPILMFLSLIISVFTIRHGLPRFVLSPEHEAMIRNLFAKTNFSFKNLVPVNLHVVNAAYQGLPGIEVMLLFKGLYDRVTSGELMAVLAHELGHQKHLDILKIQALSLLFIFIRLFLIRWFIRRPSFFYHQGFRKPALIEEKIGKDESSDDVIPILLKLNLAVQTVQLLTNLLTGPLFHLIFWNFEYAADSNAVSLGYGRELISFFIKLATEIPQYGLFHWLYAVFYDPHPTLPMRIRAINGLLQK